MSLPPGGACVLSVSLSSGLASSHTMEVPTALPGPFLCFHWNGNTGLDPHRNFSSHLRALDAATASIATTRRDSWVSDAA
jgi:hypothetical protein